jgi:hypothetical protein
MKWLRKRIVKWLKVPQHAEMFYINNCVFVRESPTSKLYMKKVGKVIKEQAKKD